MRIENSQDICYTRTQDWRGGEKMSAKWKRNNVVFAWSGAVNKLYTGGGYGLKHNIFLQAQIQGYVYLVIDTYSRQHTDEQCKLSFLRVFFWKHRSWCRDMMRAAAS